MPFVMDQQPGPQDLKKDQNQNTGGITSQKQAVAQVNGSTSHAAEGPLPNGTSPQGLLHPTAHGGPVDEHAPAAVQEPPPELDQTWKTWPSYKYMGTLAGRLAELCFIELNEHISTMAERSVAPQAGLPNGVGSQATDKDGISQGKKRDFMAFLSGQRDKFIKTLVISDWARNGEEMARLVDIRMWEVAQEVAQQGAADSIRNLKAGVRDYKVPNPNIIGAMELLGTGKTTKAPDLGYLPTKPLTAKQLLRTLQNMNVILNTKLNLHEDLPEHFRDYSIANGRATFRVPGEFEVDLSVADDSTTSSFYFIDIRFLFKPAPAVLDEQLRRALEERTNVELASKGLEGCYKFLHNFVLTHKINVLRDQAQSLRREKWFDCLLIDRRHRTVAIQYWTGVQGPKSWLELGIGTGKPQGSGRKSRRAPTAEISVRWFRRGELVNEAVQIDWDDLDLERILSDLITRHIEWMLGSINDRIHSMAADSARASSQETPLRSVLEADSLQISMPELQTPTIVRLERFTGKFSLAPPTLFSSRAEKYLNDSKNAYEEAPPAIANLLCRIILGRVDKARELVGWQPLQVTDRTAKSAFGAQVLSSRAYLCGSAWKSGWCVYATASLCGERWYVALLEDKPATSSNATTRIIARSRRITVSGELDTGSRLSRRALLRIEKLAVAEVSSAVLAGQLSSSKIKFTERETESLTRREGSFPVGTFFPGSRILKDSVGKALAVNCVSVTHCALDGETGEVTQELRLTVDSATLKHLREFLTSRGRDAEIAMNESGGLALRFRTPFGQPYLDKMVHRVQAAARLDAYLQALKAYKATPLVLNFKEFAFTYWQSPELSAKAVFSDQDGALPFKLLLKPVIDNPHQRLRTHIEQTSHRKGANAIPYLIQALFLTAPICVALDKIESADPSRKSLTVHAHTERAFSLAYHAPLPTITFRVDFRTSTAHGKVLMRWFVTNNKGKEALQQTAFGRAWLDLASQDLPFGHMGADGNLLIHTPAIEAGIKTLDETVRRFTAENAEVKQEPAAPVADVKPVVQPPSARPLQGKISQQQPLQKAPMPQQKVTQQARTNSHHNNNNNSNNNKLPPKTHSNPPAPTANMARNNNNHQANKVKKEVIELD